MADKSREENKEYILKTAKEHDVKFIWLWFTDILGMLKSFAITVEELEGALDDGMGFDGSSIEGFARIDESEMVALPDLDTFQLVPGYEAPVYLSWARRNRSDLIRVPEYKPGKENATRIEFRSPDPACNPYLAFSVMLAAGLEGIEKGYQAPEPIEENVYEMTEEERERWGIETLPPDLLQAIQLTEKSELVRKALGEHVFDAFIKNRKIEWDQYRTQVTDYEVKKYLPVL
jgi:glutamine synthetase